MKRKQVVKVRPPENMSVADTLVVVCQTITVTLLMQKGIDPNESYDEWEANKDQFFSCVQVINECLRQYGPELDLLLVKLPDGIGMGGYRVDELDFLGKNDGLPF